jgi:iron-sulfur cluster assembly accessory protein
MLEISPIAIQEFKQLLQEKGKIGKAIRIFTMGSGCCGPSVGMDMVDTGQPEDTSLTLDGLRVFIEQKAVTALEGTTLDFSSAGPRKGFLLKHPENGGCCG